MRKVKVGISKQISDNYWFKISASETVENGTMMSTVADSLKEFCRTAWLREKEFHDRVNDEINNYDQPRDRTEESTYHPTVIRPGDQVIPTAPKQDFAPVITKTTTAKKDWSKGKYEVRFLRESEKAWLLFIQGKEQWIPKRGNGDLSPTLGVNQVMEICRTYMAGYEEIAD